MSETKVGSQVLECLDVAPRARVALFPLVVWRVIEKKLRSGEVHRTVELHNGRILRSWIRFNR